MLDSFAGAVVRSGREILFQVRLTRILSVIYSIEQKAISGAIITWQYPAHNICNLYKINKTIEFFQMGYVRSNTEAVVALFLKYVRFGYIQSYHTRPHILIA